MVGPDLSVTPPPSQYHFHRKYLCFPPGCCVYKTKTLRNRWQTEPIRQNRCQRDCCCLKDRRSTFSQLTLSIVASSYIWSLIVIASHRYFSSSMLWSRLEIGTESGTVFAHCDSVRRKSSRQDSWRHQPSGIYLPVSVPLLRFFIWFDTLKHL